MQQVLVTGGAGALGRLVVAQLVEAGYHVRIMSRHGAPGNLLPETEWAQANLETGEGIARAVQGVDVIVHAASSPFRHTQQIDVDGTRRLLEQARTAAIAHLVYISIVGIDRIPFGYYKCKLAAEDLVQQSDIPWSLLRATQFHYLIDLILRAATRFPLVTTLPTSLHFQPVAESEVAHRLREIVQSGPSGRFPDMGGPEVQTLGNLAQSWLSLRGMRRALIPLWLPGQSAHGFRRGYNTCPEQAVGKIPWAEWVRQKYQRQ
ncbi:MAG: NAD(P)H-binding protein [Ktedonobacteraceae bacterium]|nr:NAD(P)H-binding protein [Ktedonobacteraceae bacterium]MBV9616945.1 NAD(P)H-binding protein [Ktedonobacteraceae bacterium]MBV9712268.1 NAD(P)H-binding protein [Ktedonobacteraceae bacterium]